MSLQQIQIFSNDTRIYMHVYFKLIVSDCYFLLNHFYPKNWYFCHMHCFSSYFWCLKDTKGKEFCGGYCNYSDNYDCSKTFVWSTGSRFQSYLIFHTSMPTSFTKSCMKIVVCLNFHRLSDIFMLPYVSYAHLVQKSTPPRNFFLSID